MKYQKLIEDLKAVCDRHNVNIVGTCFAEGIYGEITIIDRETEVTGWTSWKEQLTNEVRIDFREDVFFGIGEKP